MSSKPHRDALLGRLVGQCIIEKKLGEGGMGMVYLARHTTLNKPVAVKLLRPNLPTTTNGVERFVREARAEARLEHPSIVSIYDAGRQNGVYYIVMQYVDGESLSARLEREHRLPADEAMRIFEAIAEGIAHAHSKGIIHRDIKPDNVLLGADGTVKIVDFGLARVIEYDQNISQSGTVVGSPAFMSPEQALGKKADERSDVYSLGATLYRMVTGVPPFQSKGFMEAIWKVVKECPQAPHQVEPEVPLELSRYIHALMRKDPRNRPQSATEALEELRELMDEDGRPRRRRRRRRLLILAAGTVLVLLALSYFVPWKRLARAVEHLKEPPPEASLEREAPDTAPWRRGSRDP